METKSAPLVEIKTNSTPGEFTAIVSAIGNIDRQGDRVMPGAFEKAIEVDPVPPVYWAHKHEIPPIGEGLEWAEKGEKLVYSGRLFVKGEVEHEFANMVYVGMKSYDGRLPAIRQFSYTYGVPEGGADHVFEQGKSVRNLHEIRPVAEVGPCFMGANVLTGLVGAAKAVDLAALQAAKLVGGAEFDFFQLGEKVEWTDEYVDALPDSAFLYVESEGKRDSTGRTTPRAKRHFAYKDAHGQIVMPRLRDAIEQAPKTEALATELRDDLRERAERILRSQEGKALLLSTIFSSKAWDDIEGYAVQRLLEMLDAAVSYIQTEYDANDVTKMKSIAQDLIGLLRRDFDEASSTDSDSNAVSAAKLALDTAVALYRKAIEMPSDAPSTISNQEMARLLSVRPTH